MEKSAILIERRLENLNDPALLQLLTCQRESAEHLKRYGPPIFRTMPSLVHGKLGIINPAYSFGANPPLGNTESNDPDC